jgi:hypothetical protein
MRYLKEFNEYQPDSQEISKWIEYIKNNYKVEKSKGERFIIIDDKPYYLTGFLFDKGQLTNKLYLDILSNNNDSDIHVSSLRKAIKDWVDSSKPNFKKLDIDEFVVFQGKDAEANDYVTFELSSPEDYWFHTKGVKGSHVLIKVKDKIPTMEVIRKAAQVAAKNSKSNDEKVLIVYCKKKFVKKEPGMNPGQVEVDHNNAYEITVSKK